MTRPSGRGIDARTLAPPFQIQLDPVSFGHVDMGDRCVMLVEIGGNERKLPVEARIYFPQAEDEGHGLLTQSGHRQGLLCHVPVVSGRVADVSTGEAAVGKDIDLRTQARYQQPISWRVHRCRNAMNGIRAAACRLGI